MNVHWQGAGRCGTPLLEWVQAFESVAERGCELDERYDGKKPRLVLGLLYPLEGCLIVAPGALRARSCMSEPSRCVNQVAP